MTKDLLVVYNNQGKKQQEFAQEPIIIGGNQLNEQVCQYVGADAGVNDAMSGVRWCQRLLGQ